MKKIILFTLVPLLAVSCSNGGNSKPKKNYYDVRFQSAVVKDGDHYIDLNYHLPYKYLSFKHESTVFSKELAVLSYSENMLNDSKERLDGFYQAFGFDDIYYSPDYDRPVDKDTVKYSIAHILKDEEEIIALTINGINYTKEWESNLTIGESGNAEGFQNGADKILSEGLTSYLEKYNNYKLWINGYSRGAAIGNIISYTLIDDETVSESNLYSYLFETPLAIDESVTGEYNSIFNIINSGDIVTYLPFKEYGFKRVGKEIDIYQSPNATDQIAENFNSKIILSPFKKSSTPECNNEVDLINYIISQMLYVREGDNEQYNITTRDEYHTRIEPKISYLFGLVMSLKAETIADIMSRLQDMMENNPMAILALLGDNGLYNFLKPILDEHGETYKEEDLQEALNYLVKIITTCQILLLAITEDNRNNVLRTVQLHGPETVFPLLLEYQLPELQ